MDIKEKIHFLVLLSDRVSVGIPVQVPPVLIATKLLPSTLAKYAPDFHDRLVALSWEFAYNKWAQDNKNISFLEFQALCMKPESHYLYSDAMAVLAEKIPREVTLEYLGVVLGK